jgi:methylthioribose-1-phosphate isomerase
MLVGNKKYQSIWIEGVDPGSVKVIDQRYLPFQFIVKELFDHEDAFEAIQKMVVRGAPLIGVTAAFGLWLASLQLNNYAEMERVANYLKSSRPTAVNLQYAVDKQLENIRGITGQKKIQTILLKGANEIMLAELNNSIAIGKAGLPLIEKAYREKGGTRVNILTHCNAGWLACVDYGTATAPIYHAHDMGIPLHVWVDETRPRNQGAKLTAWELQEHGVPCTIIADNTGGHLMQHGMVDMVIVGSDRTSVNGDVANKIGTYLKALAAWDNNIPFYVALPTSTIDVNISDGVKEIPIEERAADEIHYLEGMIGEEYRKVRISTPGSRASNYGFDVTPARLITSLITEKGICNPTKKAIVNLINRHQCQK